MSSLTRFWGLILAYWRSDRWIEAWTLTLAVLALTTLLSKASVWTATASADFIASIAGYHSPEAGVDPAALLLTSTFMFFAIYAGRAAGIAVRHLLSTTLHRRARAWLVGRFDAAILADERTAFDLMSDRADDGGVRPRLPDAIDQRVDECTTGLYGGLIGLAMGLWGAVTSVWFVSIALIERSVPVPALDRLAAGFSAWIEGVFGPEAARHADLAPGEYGSAVLAWTLIALYVPLITAIAWMIGRVLERQNLQRQKHDGAWRGELAGMLSRVTQLAISRGERVQRRINDRLYADIDRTWTYQNNWHAGMMLFDHMHGFLSRRLLAYLPALPAFTAGGLPFRDFVSSSELTAELIGDISWFINVMPAIATLRANATRLTDLAMAIERVRERQEFYSETGISRFDWQACEDVERLELEDVALRHCGHHGSAFLSMPRLRLRAGEWLYLSGQNGCGKSSLLKAIAGLWPYGSGHIRLGAHSKLYFAGQEADLPDRLSLHALVAYPDHADSYSQAAVAASLYKVGLGKFIGSLEDELYCGKNWRNVFSGGQKQRLVLARILLHAPDIVLLDEATSAMDTAGIVEFHQTLREHLPDAAVLSVLHGDKLPRDDQGRHFYDGVIEIENKLAIARPLERRRRQLRTPGLDQVTVSPGFDQITGDPIMRTPTASSAQLRARS